MHILLIHQAFTSLDEPGGTRHHEFARHLSERGHRVSVIASQVSYLTGAPLTESHAEEGQETTKGVTVLRTRGQRRLHNSFVQRTLAFIAFMVNSFFLGLRVKKVDLVWGTSPPIFQGITAWLLARIKRVPFLFEVRDLWPSFAIALGVLKNPLLIALSNWLERFLYSHADVVLVNSPGYVEHVKARGARRVTLVPNSADPEMFDPADKGSAFRAAHHLGKKFVVLYAGAHGVSNDLGVLLDAAAILQQDTTCRDVIVILLGDGKEKTTLQAQAERMGLGNVLFLPPVPKTGMAEALAAADACLAILKPLPEYRTTYPNKVFDYMAAGRPVVLAIDGVIRQVVESAGCGLFAQPGNPPALAVAIKALASDPQKSLAMGFAGRRALEEDFSRAQMAERLLSILSELVHEKLHSTTP